MDTIIIKGDSQKNNALLVLLPADYTCKCTNFMRSTSETEKKISEGGIFTLHIQPNLKAPITLLSCMIINEILYQQGLGEDFAP